MQRSVLSAAAVIVAVGMAGCQTVSLTGGSALVTPGFSYEAGTAAQLFPFSTNQVQTAGLEAMADLKMHSVRQTVETNGTSFHGLTADNRRVSMTVSQVMTGAAIVSGAKGGPSSPAETQARVTARIGWLGDEPLSRALLDRVGVRLGSAPPAAIPSEPPSQPEAGIIFGGRENNPPSVRRMNDGGYRDTPMP